jgi:hypothetical protein
MQKFFIISDVHGFYDEMVKALNEAGFDPNNEEHWVITCGDHFDRGPKPLEVMRYLRNLPRKILVKGNHEQLLVDCCRRGDAGMHDYHNGTYDTICKIGDAEMGYAFSECCDIALSKTRLFLGSMVDYFETKNYIFVHSWVPLISKDGLPAYYSRNRKFEFRDDWRKASAQEWSDAMWGNPFELAEQGLLPDKTVVFGHWHCSTGWAKAEGRSEFGEDATFEPYHGDGFISIDACTAHSGKVNVLVLEDEFIEGSC